MFAWLRKLFGGSSAPQLPNDTSSKGVYSQLRHAALCTQREKVGITTPPIQSPVWGVLMELGIPNATATLFTLNDGTSSLYLSSGGGVIGGKGHQAVEKANALLIEVGNELIPHLKPTNSYPIPSVGQTVFFVLTDAGVLWASAVQEELNSGRHPLSPLYFAGHMVLTELRLLSETEKRALGVSGG